MKNIQKFKKKHPAIHLKKCHPSTVNLGRQIKTKLVPMDQKLVHMYQKLVHMDQKLVHKDQKQVHKDQKLVHRDPITSPHGP